MSSNLIAEIKHHILTFQGCEGFSQATIQFFSSCRVFDKLHEVFSPSLVTGLGVEGLGSSEGQCKLSENSYGRQNCILDLDYF